MIRTFKRGYVEKHYKSGFIAIVTKVTQSDEFGKLEDIDEDEQNRYSGYNTVEEAIKDLKEYFKCKEIIKEL